MRRREDIMLPSEIEAEYPNAVAHLTQDGELVFTAELAIGGMDEDGTYFLVLDGPAQGEKAYV